MDRSVKTALAAIATMAACHTARAQQTTTPQQLPETENIQPANDFGMWASVEGEKELGKRWSIGMEIEARTRNHVRSMERISGGISADFKITKWLKASAGYTFIGDHAVGKLWYGDNVYDMDGNLSYRIKRKYRPEYWRIKHRTQVSLTASHKVGRFKLSLRERWQYTYRPEMYADRWVYASEKYEKDLVKGEGKSVLRSRFEAEYDIRNCPLEPYANVELTNNWSVSKVRCMGGLTWKIDKKNSLGTYYLYQTVPGDDGSGETNMNVIGVKYKVKF